MKSWIALLSCALLGACATGAAPVVDDSLWQDAAFAPATSPVRTDTVFALSDEMREYLRTRGAQQMRLKGKQRGLIDALYAHGDLKLMYDAAVTRTASEAFAARSGNCLSLVIMTGAFAKELGLQVEFQSAYTDETWSRSGDLYFRSGHVNVTLGRRLVDSGYDSTLYTVDFLPQSELRGLRTTRISETDVISMYLNNRAAELMVQDRMDDAYWWSREAVRTQPGSLSALNTLGVIYQRRGLLQPAERVFDAVLARDPRHTRALHNLAQVLTEQGRVDESQALRSRLARLEPEPAYYFFERGQAAMRAGDFHAARDWFAKEVARADYSPEFHFWLGLAHFKLGEIDAARQHLQQARANSQTRSDRDLYAAKLERLNALQTP
jgi:tetratricopeptide (TPR) repeat protein